MQYNVTVFVNDILEEYLYKFHIIVGLAKIVLYYET